MKLVGLRTGRPGTDRQVEGLLVALEALDLGPSSTLPVRPHPALLRLPRRVRTLLARRGPLSVLGAAATAEARRGDLAGAMIVSAGASAALSLAALARARPAALVQILDPEMSFDDFTFVALPEHDERTGGNVLATIGSMGTVSRDSVRRAAAAIAGDFEGRPSPRLAVLIGGPSADSLWRDADAEALARACVELSASGWTLLVTPSDRTPPSVVETLERSLDDRHFIWRDRSRNPYPGMLAYADAILVTEDSVNMASEAASSGLPVHVFPISDRSPKMRRFHAALASRGAARLFDGGIGSWTYEPLDEAKRIAETIRDRRP